jgi:hypothetical protein
MNIQYAVDWEAEDAPEFRLFSPANTANYSLLELLAIMRALRYNESFHSISFRDINLHSMHGLYDSYGKDHIASTNRAGMLCCPQRYNTNATRSVITKILQYKAPREISTVPRGPSFSSQVRTITEDGFWWLSS